MRYLDILGKINLIVIFIYIHIYFKFKSELEEAFQEWNTIQTLQENLNKGSSSLKFKFQTSYKVFITQWILRFIALQMILLSLATTLSEFTLYLNINVSIIGMLVNTSSSSPLLVHIITVIPLGFLFYACLFGMFNLKIAGLFGMYRNNHTDATSLLLMSSFMCRIGFPLCINFVQILKLKKRTVLEEIVGSTDLDPLFGTNFFIIYPAVLVVLILLNLLNVYENILRMFGVSYIITKNAITNDKIKEGQLIFGKSNFLILIFIF